jgi:tetratricopeptide (TPR) repeat protein
MVNLEHFREAAGYNSVGNQEVREQLSQAAISVINTSEQPLETKQAFFDLARTELEKQVSDAPESARAPFFLGILYDHAGVHAEAKKWLDVARERAPRKQQILFALGQNALARGAPDEMLAYFKEAYESAPEYHEAQSNYAAALIRTGDIAEGERVLQPRIDAGSAAEQRIAAAYASQGRYDRMIVLWSDHIGKNPQDLEARFLLAGAYYTAGNSAAAIRVLEETKAAIPSAAADADGLIQQIKSGAAAQ